MKKFFFVTIGIFVLLQCILSLLSSLRVESAPLENQPHYSVVNAPLFVFENNGGLRMQLYNNTDEAIYVEDYGTLPYKVLDKNGQLTNLNVSYSVLAIPPQPVPVVAHGKHDVSHTFHIDEELPPGKYKMQVGIFEYGTSKEIFPSAEFEFYYIPLPYYLF